VRSHFGKSDLFKRPALHKHFFKKKNKRLSLIALCSFLSVPLSRFNYFLQLSKHCDDFVGRQFAGNYRQEARAPSVLCAFFFMLSTVRTIVLSAVFLF
jgi:hypothetical protein